MSLPKLPNSKQIADTISALRKIADTPEGKAAIKRVTDQQQEVELVLLSKQQICNAISGKELASINTKNLQRLLEDEYYNPLALKFVQCLLTTIWGNVSANARSIRDWIQLRKRIGGDSAYGYALLGDIKRAKEVVVLKVPKVQGQEADLIHELSIGMLATNALRDSCPNFAYVFGGFACSPSVIDEERDVLTWCTGPSGTQYITYENITPSITMQKYIEVCSADEFFTIFMQIVLALRLAQRRVDFCHYDMKTDNVLVRDLPDHKSAVQIELDGYYIRASKVATIIDYGLSHAKVQGVNLGKRDLEIFGVLPDRAYPLADVYRLLCFSLLIMRNAANPAVDQIAPLLQAMVDEPVKDVLEKQIATLYSLPALPELVAVTYDQILAFFATKVKLNLIISTKPWDDLELLNCNGGACASPAALTQYLNLQGPVKPVDLNSLYEYILSIGGFAQGVKLSQQGNALLMYDQQGVDGQGQRVQQINTSVIAIINNAVNRYNNDLVLITNAINRVEARPVTSLSEKDEAYVEDFARLYDRVVALQNTYRQLIRILTAFNLPVNIVGLSKQSVDKVNLILAYIQALAKAAAGADVSKLSEKQRWLVSELQAFLYINPLVA